MSVPNFPSLKARYSRPKSDAELQNDASRELATTESVPGEAETSSFTSSAKLPVAYSASVRMNCCVLIYVLVYGQTSLPRCGKTEVVPGRLFTNPGRNSTS